MRRKLRGRGDAGAGRPLGVHGGAAGGGGVARPRDDVGGVAVRVGGGELGGARRGQGGVEGGRRGGDTPGCP